MFYHQGFCFSRGLQLSVLDEDIYVQLRLQLWALRCRCCYRSLCSFYSLFSGMFALLVASGRRREGAALVSGSWLQHCVVEISVYMLVL